MRTRSTVIFCLAALALLAAPAAWAKTLEVGTGHPYANISDAAGVAATGDVVVVYPGTYMVYPGNAQNDILITAKDITLRSANPADPATVAATIIQSLPITSYQTCYSMIRFNGTITRNCILAGFTIRNSIDPYYGSAVRITDGCSPTIYNCVFTNNVCGNDVYGYGPGGAIWAGTGAPMIRNCTFTGNAARNNSQVGYGGGAIFSRGAAVIHDNIFNGNTATDGGAVSCSANAYLYNNTFKNNHAASGGGLYVYKDPGVRVENNVFSGNSITDTGGCGGALYVWCNGQITGNTFTKNTAPNGGAIYVEQFSPTFTRNLIYNNSATQRGGGVDCRADLATPLLVNCTIANNTSPGPNTTFDQGGGNIWCGDGTTLKNCLITGALSGGGIDNRHGTAPTVTYCDVYGNVGGDYVHMSTPGPAAYCLSAPPLYGYPPGGDFHLKSKYGRWAQATKTWVTDPVLSPGVNAGDPASPCSLEPAPNGSRLNLGYEGNTAHASKSGEAAPLLAWTGAAGYTVDGVKPDVALPGATFTFQVKYRQVLGAAPTAVKLRVWNPSGVEIANSPFAMTSDGTTNWSTGVTFSKAVALGAHGAFSYQFTATQGTTTITWPAPKMTGPAVNHPPVLKWDPSAGFVTRGVNTLSGPLSGSFTFRVWYSDPDGDAPASPEWVTFYVWNTAHPADAPDELFCFTDASSPNYVTGASFYRTWYPEASGSYQYAVKTSDRWGTVRFPATGRMAGPTVTVGSPAPAVSGVSARQVGAGVALTYALSADAEVRVTIYNLAGRVIAQVPAGPQAAGVQTLRWNGRNTTGSLVPAGVYLLQVEAAGAEGSQSTALTSVNLRR